MGVEKRHRVYIQNVSVYAGTTRTCVETCTRGAGTHGDVLNPHTEGRGSSSVLLTRICPRMVITWPQRSTKSNHCILQISSLRGGREQHVPDSSNHSLYLMKLFVFSCPEGNKLLDCSIRFRSSSLSSTNMCMRMCMCAYVYVYESVRV